MFIKINFFFKFKFKQGMFKSLSNGKMLSGSTRQSPNLDVRSYPPPSCICTQKWDMRKRVSPCTLSWTEILGRYQLTKFYLNKKCSHFVTLSRSLIVQSLVKLVENSFIFLVIVIKFASVIWATKDIRHQVILSSWWLIILITDKTETWPQSNVTLLSAFLWHVRLHCHDGNTASCWRWLTTVTQLTLWKLLAKSGISCHATRHSRHIPRFWRDFLEKKFDQIKDLL